MITLTLLERLVYSTLQMRPDGLTMRGLMALCSMGSDEVTASINALILDDFVRVDSTADGTPLYIAIGVWDIGREHNCPRTFFNALTCQLAIAPEFEERGPLKRDWGLVIVTSILMNTHDPIVQASVTGLPIEFHIAAMYLMNRHEMWWLLSVLELADRCLLPLPVDSELVEVLGRVVDDCFAVSWTENMRDALAVFHSGMATATLYGQTQMIN